MECIGGTPLIALWGGRHCHSFPPLAQQHHHPHQEHHHPCHQQHHHGHQQKHCHQKYHVSVHNDFILRKVQWLMSTARAPNQPKWIWISLVILCDGLSTNTYNAMSKTNSVWWISQQYQQCLKPRPISTMECQSRPPSISISLTEHSSISDCKRTTGELIRLTDVLRASHCKQLPTHFYFQEIFENTDWEPPNGRI